MGLDFMRVVEELDRLEEQANVGRKGISRDTALLTVGRADDPAERRADAVANAAMRQIAPSAFGGGSFQRTQRNVSVGGPRVGPGVGDRVQRSWNASPPLPTGAGPRIRRATHPGARTDSSSFAGPIGRDGGEVDEASSQRIQRAVAHGGRLIDEQVSDRLSAGLGEDMGGIRIHTNREAGELAQRMSASAFTVGRDVFFAPGQYRPNSSDGMRTLLHEAAHVADNRGRVQRSAIRRKVSVSVAEFDKSFNRTGIKGLVKSRGHSEINKISELLKRYHKSRPGEPAQLDALQSLLSNADVWLRKHPKPKDDRERSRIDLVDSIRTQAGIEYAKLQASNIYMGDANSSKVLGGQKAAQGPGSHPLEHLKQGTGFAPTSYQKRADPNNYGGGAATRARTKHGISAPDAATEQALTEALDSLSPAQYAAIATYSEADYAYINPGISGRTAKKGNESKVEEAALHAGFIGEAWSQLPVWSGTTYRGQAMSKDFLGFTSRQQLKVDEYWSSTEARKVGQDFIRDYCDGKHIAALFTIDVTNGRDISRISSSGQELEILLPPGSIYAVGRRRCLIRGRDDDEIRTHFGDDVFDKKHLTEFWVVSLSQRYSGDNDPSGRYTRAGAWAGATAGTSATRYANPWAGFSNKRIIGTPTTGRS